MRHSHPDAAVGRAAQGAGSLNCSWPNTRRLTRCPHANRHIVRAVPASTTGAPPAVTAVSPAPADAATFDPYIKLGQLCAATGPVAVGHTVRGRGLVLQSDMQEREGLLTVPLHNALIITDEPTGGISIFSDKQHRKWQELHGQLPPLLLEFLQGDARWDARMAGWLLWMVQHPSPLWCSYLAMLPAESEMSCMLNFSPAEIEELQVPQLKEEAAIQASWCAHLHAKYFSTATGSLASLGLSSSLAHSLWAISLVRSRTFSEDVNGEMLTLMVPYCDLANHCSNHNSTFCIGRDFKSFSLRSLQPLSKGEELTISYGAEKPNSEVLRDYGFVLFGNSHDRIQWGSSSRKVDETEAKAEREKLKGMYGLNEACLMEAASFSGDLEKQKDLQPIGASQQLSPQQLARREATLLSMPLKSPNSSSSGGGGLFGWLTDAAQPWTESGRPPPQPLQPYQAAAELAAVRTLQQQLHSQLSSLPTSIQTDQQLLAQLEARGSDGSSSSAGVSGSNGSSGGSSAGLQSVQQRRHTRLQQQQQSGAAPQPLLAASPAADSRPPSAARLMTALRARLEHKLLLQEGLNVLQLYEQLLASKFGAL